MNFNSLCHPPPKPVAFLVEYFDFSFGDTVVVILHVVADGGGSAFVFFKSHFELAFRLAHI